MKFIRPYLLARIAFAPEESGVYVNARVIDSDRAILLPVCVRSRISKCVSGFRRLICIENLHFLLDSIYRFIRFDTGATEGIPVSAQPLYMIEVFDA